MTQVHIKCTYKNFERKQNENEAQGLDVINTSEIKLQTLFITWNGVRSLFYLNTFVTSLICLISGASAREARQRSTMDNENW